METSRPISASMEDYLEAIAHIAKANGAARAKNISERLQVTGASVTGALRQLSDRGLVRYEPYGVVTLTEEGARVADSVIRRHEAFRDFLVTVLSVPPAEAEEAACRMEHQVPDAILERFLRFMEFARICPAASTHWVAGVGYFCLHGETRERCACCQTSHKNGGTIDEAPAE